MSSATLRIQKISGHAGPVAGAGTQREEKVAKLIDTTTCIGCKACEVACVEWNDMPFRETAFDNSYQTMAGTEWNYWTLIRFDEHAPENGAFQWLMRKDGCMHCAEPGCLRAFWISRACCSRRRSCSHCGAHLAKSATIRQLAYCSALRRRPNDSIR